MRGFKLNKRKTAVVILCCLIGLGTATGYLLKIRSIRREISRLEIPVEVLTASESLKIGDRLSEENLRVSTIPSAYIPNRAILSEDLELIIDRVLAHPVPIGDPILWTDLPEGPRINFPTEKIPPGYRAIALPADETRTLIHLLSPGDRVDIAWSRVNDNTGFLECSLIGEGVYVLAIGSRLSAAEMVNDANDFPSSITLLVSPEQALKITRAAQVGEIILFGRARGEIPASDPKSADHRIDDSRNRKKS